MSKINKILIGFLIVLIVVCIVLGIGYKKVSQNTENEEIKKYYEYFDNQGKISQEYLINVKLLENYRTMKASEDTVEIVLERIVRDSSVEIPEDILKSLKNDALETIKLEAEQDNIEINEYLQQQYSVNNIEEYWNKNKEEYTYKIKTDLVYQKLADELNIEVTDEDIKEYFNNLIVDGKTIEDIKDNYGESLTYQYTMEYKIKKVLLNK